MACLMITRSIPSELYYKVNINILKDKSTSWDEIP